MSFKDANQVWNVVDAIRQAGVIRSRNRARINSVFNGDPPYTPEEARNNNIDTNVNFLEGTRIIHQSRQQFTNAFMQPANYFTVSLDFGPTFKRDTWGRIITKRLNRTLKRSMKYGSTLENQFASSVLHGVGPATWTRKTDWCPRARGIDDMMVPTNTLQSLENLDHFAVRISFTASELVRIIATPKHDPGWNAEMIKRIIPILLRRQTTANNAQDQYDWTNYEKLVEDWKQSSTYWGSDAIPVVWCFDFYYLDTNVNDGEPKWRRKIIVDRQTTGFSDIEQEYRSEFLYDGKQKEYGQSLEQLMHTQFADGAVVPPFKWHSIRSLGFLLYAVCHLQNRIRCKFTDATFESMLWYFRNVAEGDEERLGMITLKHLGIIPQGVDFVKGGERHTIDPNLVQGYISGMRELMAESAASYVQDVEQRGNTPPSATQIIAQVNNANALIGTMLTRAYTLQTPGYREVARRFAKLEIDDCKRFREDCMKQGVPGWVFDRFEGWNIEPERVLGNGNKMMKIAQADRLMGIRSTLPPATQPIVTRMFIEATTDDPAMADKLQPVGEEAPTPSSQLAALAWGTLIDSKPVPMAPTVNPIEFSVALLALLEMDLQQIQKSGQLPDARRVLGLSNVHDTIETMAMQVAQDAGNKEIADEIIAELEQAAEIIKQFAQGIQEQQAAASESSQLDPETQAKIQAILIQATTKAKIAEANAQMKRQQKEMAFVQDQARKDAMLESEIATEDIRTKAEIARSALQPPTPQQ